MASKGISNKQCHILLWTKRRCQREVHLNTQHSLGPASPPSLLGTGTSWQASRVAAAWPLDSWGLSQLPLVSATSRGDKDSSSRGLSARAEAPKTEGDLQFAGQLRPPWNSGALSTPPEWCWVTVLWVTCWVCTFLSYPHPTCQILSSLWVWCHLCNFPYACTGLVIQRNEK